MANNIKVLANPTVKINNVLVRFKANSVEVTSGKGTRKTEGISEGGGASSVAVSEDVSTRIGKFKGSMFTSAKNSQLLRDWQSVDLNIGNVITVSEDDYGETIVGAVVANDPGKAFAADGSFDVEFEGAPAI